MKHFTWIAVIVLFFTATSLTTSKAVSTKAEYQTYSTIKIGNQVWMSENLNSDKFRNGDLIPEAKSKKEWEEATQEGNPAWCYINNKAKKGGKYGRLYNWYAVNDPRGLAPAGWHIPNHDEIKALRNNIKSYGEGPHFRAKEDWDTDCPTYYQSTNTTGFSALPAGFREADGSFDDDDTPDALFWMSEKDKEWGEDRSMHFELVSCSIDFKIKYAEWGIGMSVRCIKN